MRLTALLALALAAVACDGGPTPDEPDAATSVMELSLGTVDAAGAGFVPLAGDQPLVPGSQSGFHVWLKYRVRGHAPGTMLVKRTARRVSDGRLILRADGVVDLGAPGPDGAWELEAPVPSFMCPSPLGVQVRDLPVRFTVELVDPDSGAVRATASAEATPRCPAEHQAFCERICSG